MRIDTVFLRPMVAAVFVLSVAACDGGDDDDGTPPPSDISLALEPVARVNFPTTLASPPGDARLFVTEKGGTVRIIKDGMLLPTPFLDIVALVLEGGERGLLGLAFDPEYATNGRFFVSYTNQDGDNVVASYLVSPGDPDVANPTVEDIRLVVLQPESNHNGGHIVFGPDDYLYVGRGDGGGSGDPQGNGQLRTTLLGKILRLDVAGPADYTIPADNPHAGSTSQRPEIWSYGLRNPWRFSFDRETGDLYIGDVGQDSWEEVNVVTAASGGGRDVNFGWDVMEGRHCHQPSSGCDMAGLTQPVFEYGHGGGGCSVAGGFVYRGAAIPALRGTYFHADLCGAWIRTFRYVAGAATSEADTGLNPGSEVVSFGEDDAGELYVLTSAGDIYRIIEA